MNSLEGAILTRLGNIYTVRAHEVSGLDVLLMLIFIELDVNPFMAIQMQYKRREERNHRRLLSGCLLADAREGQDEKKMQPLKFVLITTALMAVGATGCATKNYVRTQTAPLVEHTDQLDARAAANSRQISDVDSRAQAGIGHAQSSADAASQNAQTASRFANDAQSEADNAVHRADTLDSVVKGLDNYKKQADVTVTFGFDKAVLTKDDRAQLDTFAAQLGAAKSYILEVTGGTDSTGPAQYNYDLSQRRADAVVQYLASKYGIAAHRFYLIGIGKDQEVAPNTTAEGRRQNRRVEVQLLLNQGIEAAKANVQ
jgi:outer membrane protein OmpA-like peptidoglycan-associated protein